MNRSVTAKGRPTRQKRQVKRLLAAAIAASSPVKKLNQTGNVRRTMGISRRLWVQASKCGDVTKFFSIGQGTRRGCSDQWRREVVKFFCRDSVSRYYSAILD